MTWILILTLISTNPSGGTSIESVAGFGSRQECLDAGKLWIDNIPSVFARKSAVCVIGGKK